MGWLDWLKKSSGPTVRQSRGMRTDPRAAYSAITIQEARNWEAAETTEENSHQWWNATGQDINQVMVDHYERICNRSQLEARRNPTVEGVIKTHATDVVGDEGPGLVMMTDDDAWNRARPKKFGAMLHKQSMAQEPFPWVNGYGRICIKNGSLAT